MNNALIEYLNRRLEDKKVPGTKSKIPGPLITISREVGCNGVSLAQKVADHLNAHHPDTNWKVLSKEIFYHSARQLDMEPQHVKRIFKLESYTLRDILYAFGTKKYKSEKMVIKTVKQVIHSFATEGYYIIVGRAAHIIARDIKNALHLRLVAPLEFRTDSIMYKNSMTKDEALDFISKIEKERSAFRKAIREDLYRAECFDLCINRASFNDEETLELIELAAGKKGVLKNYRHASSF